MQSSGANGEEEEEMEIKEEEPTVGHKSSNDTAVK